MKKNYFCSKCRLFVTFCKQTEKIYIKFGFLLHRISKADKHFKISKLACLRDDL